MSFARAAASELTLRRRVRGDLTVWARLALSTGGQVPARHHRLMMSRLQALSQGNESARLMLLLPPGSAKSTYASVIFPAWWLARAPRSSIIAVSHTAPLAEEFGRRTRRLIEDHSARLGVTLRGESRAAGRFETLEGGSYYATGVGGGVTGRRADLAIIDDPIHSLIDADSRARRERLWEWFRAELVTRVKPRGRVLLVMARWHQDDLAGRLIEQGGWDVLRLPALAGFGDAMGRAPGEALWPEWENAAVLEERRRAIGERSFASLYQQTPMGLGGTMFDAAGIVTVDIAPVGETVRAWDLAASGDDRGNPDWTVGLRLVRGANGVYCVDDVRRLRGGPAEVVAAIVSTAREDGLPVAVGLPQDPGQAGKAQVLYLTRALAGFRVVATPETGSKRVRAMPVASQAAVGNLVVRRAAWTAYFLEELASFPNGVKDDQVDALARAFAMLTTTGGAPARFSTMPHFER